MTLVYEGRILRVYREGSDYRFTIATQRSTTHLTMSEVTDLVTAIVGDQAGAVAGEVIRKRVTHLFLPPRKRGK